MHFAAFVCGCLRMYGCSSILLPAKEEWSGCMYIEFTAFTEVDISDLHKWLCPVDQSPVLGSFRILQRSAVTT